MKFGLFSLISQREQSSAPHELFKELSEQVVTAEKSNFDIAWFAEHHFSNYCLCPSPLTMASFLAGKTSKIKLGPAVIVAPLYEKLRLMEDIGLVDQLSGGRLVLGFGAGYQKYELHKFGVELVNARDHLPETLDLLEVYMNQDEVKFKGAHIDVPPTHFPVKPIQKRIPTYVAGSAGDPGLIERAVKHGYTPFITTGWNSGDTIAGVREKISSAWEKAGGNRNAMPFAIQRYVFVTDSKREAEMVADGARYIRRVATAMRNNYGQLEGAFIKEVPADDEPSLQEIESRLLVGNVETVWERLQNDIARYNPGHISCLMAFPGMKQSSIINSIEKFGSEIIPKLSKSAGR